MPKKSAAKRSSPPQSEQPGRGTASQRVHGQRSYPLNQRNVDAARRGTLGARQGPPKPRKGTGRARAS